MEREPNERISITAWPALLATHAADGAQAHLVAPLTNDTLTVFEEMNVKHVPPQQG